MNATAGKKTVDREVTLAARALFHVGAFLSAAIIFFLHVDAALAYRPFDGTDAAVADPGRGKMSGATSRTLGAAGADDVEHVWSD